MNVRTMNGVIAALSEELPPTRVQEALIGEAQEVTREWERLSKSVPLWMRIIRP